jgi:sugar phosphate isomerase/epimerase
MRLAFSTNAYLRYSLDEAVRRVAGLGYQGIEIMADVPHAWPAGLLGEYKQGIRRVLADNGLSISNVNAFMMNAIADPRHSYWHPSWLESERHYRQIRVEHTRRSLTLARELGALSITTEPGGPLAPGMSRGSAMKLFAEVLKPVAEHAEKEGVLLLVEPEPGLLIENSDQFLEFMQLVDSPAIGLNFDVGHFFCVGEDPPVAIRRLAPYIRHFHLEDIATTRVHHHLVPGEGVIDFRSTFRAIKDIGYAGWITIELYPYVDNPDEAARTAFQRIAPLLNTD